MSSSISPTVGPTGAVGIAAAGVLLGAGGGMHPRVDTSLTFDAGLAGAAGVAIWAVVAGIRTARQTVVGRADRLAPAHGHPR